MSEGRGKMLTRSRRLKPSPPADHLAVGVVLDLDSSPVSSTLLMRSHHQNDRSMLLSSFNEMTFSGPTRPSQKHTRPSADDYDSDPEVHVLKHTREKRVVSRASQGKLQHPRKAVWK